MPHPLVIQLRFTRSEWLRALQAVSDEDSQKRLLPMNSIGWMAAHLAWQEQSYWLERAQGKILAPEVKELAGYGKPASTPRLSEMLDAWRRITAAVDEYLDTITTETLQTHLSVNGKTLSSSVGTMLLRMIYHYWYHIGEALAVRQLLGHTNLPEYVGKMDELAPYVPES